MIISKELLGEVYPEAIPYMEDISKIELLNYTEVHYGVYSSSHINIYELAHKCKEWAHKKGYYISSWVTSLNEGFAETNEYGYTAKDMFDADTEPQAIFKACEWIRKERS